MEKEQQYNDAERELADIKRELEEVRAMDESKESRVMN